MGTLRAAGGRIDFRDYLSRGELMSVIIAVNRGELSLRQAALMLSPEATIDDIEEMAADLDRRRAA